MENTLRSTNRRWQEGQEYELINIQDDDQLNQFRAAYSFNKFLWDNKVNIKVYFDAADVINIVAGLTSLDDGLQVRMELYDDPSYFVYGFAYRKWLGAVHLLPPHYYEFLEIRKAKPLLFPVTDHLSTYREVIFEDFSGKKTLKSLKANANSFNSPDSLRQLTRNLKIEAKDLFKSYYLLSEQDWRERYAYLFKNNKIICSPKPEDYKENNLPETDLFREIKGYLDRAREGGTENNYVDALALCLLQEKTRAYNESVESGKRDLPLPIFYSHQDHILDTVAHFSAEKGYFTCWDKKNGAQYLVVQESPFFIVRGIAQRKRDITLVFQQFLDSAIDEKPVEKGGGAMSDQLTASRKDMHQSASEAMVINFLEEWWKEEGCSEYFELLQSDKHKDTEQSKIDRDRLKKEVIQIIREDEEAVRDKLFDISLRRTCWRHLQKLEGTIANMFKPEGAKLGHFDIDEELGTRLAFPKEVCERTKILWRKLLENASTKEASYPANDPNHEGFTPHCATLVNYLVEGALDTKKSVELSVGLAILMICGQKKLNKLMAEICRHSRDKCREEGNEDQYPCYQVGLLHALAIARSQRDDNMEAHVKNILKCIEDKQKENYKAWIGLSIVYYNLWKQLAEYHNVPETILPSQRYNDVESGRNKILEKAIDLSYKAYEWLNDNWAKANMEERRPKLYYAINIYIYFATLSHNLERFERLDVYVQQFDGAKNTANWQVRFYDTLAYYYLRSGILQTDPKNYEADLDEAKTHNDQSKMRAHHQEHLNDYIDLGNKIRNFRYKIGFAKYQKKYVPSPV